MARFYFPLYQPVLTLLLLVYALQSNAVPTKTGTHNPLVLFNASTRTTGPNPTILPHCYTPENPQTRGIQPVSLQACKDALHVLVRQPHFTDRYRFSRNPRAQAMKLPLGWQLGQNADCRIVVNCANDQDSAFFRFADVAQVARQIIGDCVDRPDPDGRVPLFRWGGVNRLRDENTFYVAVARPLQPLLASEGVTNGTVGIGWGSSVDGGVEIL